MPPISNFFHPSKAAGKLGEGLRRHRRIEAHGLSGRHCGTGVIDVVTAGQIDLCLVFGLADAENDGGLLGVGRDDLRHGDVGLRAAVAALRAAIAAEVAIGDIVVDIFALAADAVRRVGQLFHARGVDRRVDAEEDHRIFKIVVDRRAERIVRVQAERRVRAVADADLDVFQRVRHLTVAVELVVEEVRHHDGLRVDERGNRLERRLVRLDQCVRIAAPAEQGGVHGELGGHAAGAGLRRTCWQSKRFQRQPTTARSYARSWSCRWCP